MRTIGEILGSPFKPLLVCLVVLMGLGLLSTDPTTGSASAGGVSCPAFTSNADFNRTVCKLNPMRLLDLPVSAVLPAFLKG